MCKIPLRRNFNQIAQRTDIDIDELKKAESKINESYHDPQGLKAFKKLLMSLIGYLRSIRSNFFLLFSTI
ncbi:MAG: hypothetical protein C4560_07195 [Nitrospiraceae bacterium]|nr:MAG: hypothetical protein C4560_07195 [Nitrospiraceae bacterium]